MANFDVQIQALTGNAEQAEMDQWMTDGAREVINILPLRLKTVCKDFATLDTSPNSLNNIDTRGEIFSVIRSDGTVNQPCEYIDSKFNGQVTDSTSIYFATKLTPKYTVYGNTLYVYPSPTDAYPAYVEHVQFPSIDASTVSTIDKFPDEAEYLVVLYAACKVLQNKMNGKIANLPADIELPSIPTPPVLDASSINIGAMTNPVFEAPEMSPADWVDTNSWITDEEDSEMLGSRVAEINAKISEYTSRLNEAQSKFNESNTVLQKELQIAMQNANTYEQGKISKYSAELQSYQAEISQKLADYGAKIQKHGTDYQWLQGQYAQLKQDYSQGVQLLIGGNAPPQQ